LSAGGKGILHPGFGESPVALYGGDGGLAPGLCQHISGFERGEAAEKAQFEDMGLPRMNHGKAFQSVMHKKDIELKRRIFSPDIQWQV
jgi:hypothetical protein